MIVDSIDAVPEPSTAALLVAGLGVLSVVRRRGLRESGLAIGVLAVALLFSLGVGSASAVPVPFFYLTPSGPGGRRSRSVWVLGRRRSSCG